MADSRVNIPNEEKNETNPINSNRTSLARTMATGGAVGGAIGGFAAGASLACLESIWDGYSGNALKYGR